MNPIPDNNSASPAQPTAAPASGPNQAAKNPDPEVLRVALAQKINEMHAQLPKLEDNAARLLHCETELKSRALELADGSTRTLAAAVVLAIIVVNKLYLELKDASGEPLYPKPLLYCSGRLASWGIGFSKARVSRLLRAGKLYLALREHNLPTPRGAESLAVLVKLGEQPALAAWRKLTENAKGACPTLQQVLEYLAARKPENPSVQRDPWKRVAELASEGLQAARSGKSLDEVTRRLAEIEAYAAERIKPNDT